MKAFTLALIAAALVGTASAETAAVRRAALDFSGTATTSGFGEDSSFARTVQARYGKGMSADEIRADAATQGLACTEDGTSCARYDTVDACTTAWIVDLEEDGTVGGRHFKRCMGAEAD
jgi:hypothetical protein